MSVSPSKPTAQSSASSFAVPLGFQFAAVRAHIKPSGRPDFACALVAKGTTAAATFTSNRMKAAPVLVGGEHLRKSGGKVRFLAVNAGNANCATGDPGIAACRQVCVAAAERFGCPVPEVFPSSTGIIGVLLPAEKLVAALPEIESGLGSTPTHIERFAEAILTTDKHIKIAGAEIDAGGKPVRLVGVAKGSGMIAPQMVPHATMLAYIFTDAKMDVSRLQTLLTDAVERTFNRISVDGDTSTNDTVLLLASGASGVALSSNDEPKFAEALEAICASLARKIVEDGEGADHVIDLSVEGAASDEDAERVARSIANSSLVKTAFAGCDPNWGRILAAAGYSGVAINPDRVSIQIGGLPVCHNGQAAPEFKKEALRAAMKEQTVKVQVNLGMGSSACHFLGCDLTAEYVHINADYST